jgi:hypothetical protein
MHNNSQDVVDTLPQSLIRYEWMSACQFHDLTGTQVLAEVVRRVREAGSAKPLVLLDLDSTLYEVGPRTFQILREWASAEAATFPAAAARVNELKAHQVGYSVRDTFATVGLDAEAPEVASAFESAKEFWVNRFFTSAYLPFDHAYTGAAEFTRQLHELGAEIVYLTGRDEPNMGDGTRDNLIRDGFPWEIERTHLLLKADPKIEDLFHKKEAAAYVRRHGNLVASFENEPPNLVALRDLFPEAMHVFVDTICSDHPAHPRRDLYRISDFGG